MYTRDAKSLTFNGVWYVFGGDIGTTYIQDIEAFDPSGNITPSNWKTKSSLNPNKTKTEEIKYLI